MKKALIIRYCAYGDAIHFSHLPRLLKEDGFDYVAVETNPKGLQIMAENPYIDDLTCFDQTHPSVSNRPYTYLERHWESISEGFDRVINLQNSLEYGYIAMEDQNVYYQNSEVRRNKFGKENYYDISTRLAGLPDKYLGTTGEVYFTKEERAHLDNFISKHNNRFKVLFNLSGSSLHKRLMYAKELAEMIIDKYPEALIITTGDKECLAFDFKVSDSISMVNKYGFRQMLLLSSKMDLVIGGESGLMVGAGMFNTPAIQLLTAANFNNHVKYAKNDYSLQSEAACSPCHKGPYKYIGCPTKSGYPVCTYFNLNRIMVNVERAYNDCFATKSAKTDVSSLSVV